MLDENAIPPYKDELKANDVVKFFDDVYDIFGTRLTKASKRTYIKKLMEALYKDASNNFITLQNGTTSPIIVKRKYEGRASFCYFNTHFAPKDEILQAFAEKHNITYITEKPSPKINGELIAQEVLHLFDDVKINNQKVTGDKKRMALISCFQQLYKDNKRNICTLENNEQIPIIIKKTGHNNKLAYYLNSAIHRKEVLKAFAKATNTIYLDYKEEYTTPSPKHPNELTARACAKLFHSVNFCPNDEKKLEGKERILQWFHRIYDNKALNQLTLPNGETVELLVHRMSHSQRCLCLNTSDTYIKPFVLKRFGELSDSTFCFKNLDLSKDDKIKLYGLLHELAYADDKTKDKDAKEFYKNYASKAFETLKIRTPHISVTSYLIDRAKRYYNN